MSNTSKWRRATVCFALLACGVARGEGSEVSALVDRLEAAMKAPERRDHAGHTQAMLERLRRCDAADLCSETSRLLDMALRFPGDDNIQVGLAGILVRSADKESGLLVLRELNRAARAGAASAGFRVMRQYSLIRLSKPRWGGWFAGTEEAAEVVESAVLDMNCGPDTLLAAQGALRSLTVAPEQRRRMFIALVSRSKEAEVFEEPMIGLLTAADWPQLRAMVRESGDTVETFHFGAASVLVHLGDEEIIPDLAARRDSFAVFDQKFGVWIDDRIKMIRAQHPPEALFELIGHLDTGRVDFGRDLARWAMERGSQVLPAEAVRAAAVNRGERVQAMLAATHDKTTRRILENGMQSLRETAIRVGVLTEADLIQFKPRELPRNFGHSEWPEFD